MKQGKYILVTGGAGYIGSHTVIELIKNDYNVIIVDNLCNSSYDSVARIEYIVQRHVEFFNIDLRNADELDKIFSNFNIQGVIHFAALKAVGESTKLPLEYYANNVGGTISLLEVMKKHKVKTIVFSSSATVYGDATRFENMIPIPEHCPNDPTNPYGRTKFQIETILRDLHSADNSWRSAILRYFNPIGAHPSGLIGEDPLGIPNNLLPYLSQVAIGRREKLSIFGNDYDSHDGTPIRDYIHVVDLAKGHIAALNYLSKLSENEGLFREWNLGTGKGSTVFDVYNAFCKAVGTKLPYEVVGRRAGDVLNLTANPKRANTELKWFAQLTIEDACKDLWNWTTKNPFGFNVKNYSWNLVNSSDQVNYQNRLHTITNGDLKVSIANYGATIQSVEYKGKKLVNGFYSFPLYTSKDNPYFGATIGRYANRISGASFSVGGSTYHLEKNENTSTLHGGLDGFDKQFFCGPVVLEHDGLYDVYFSLFDKDGNNGFPADVALIVKYQISPSSLTVEYEAKIDEASSSSVTPLNLTNHSYWNISGGSSIDGTKIESITNDSLMLNRTTKIPTGRISKFPYNMDSLILEKDVAIDDYFVVNKDLNTTDSRSGKMKDVLSISHHDSDIRLVVSTTEPGFQLYTGDFNNVGSFGARSGLAIETGRFTNAINQKEWQKQVLLNKGSVYGSTTMFSFLS